MKNTIGESGLLGGGISKQVQDIFWFYLGQELGEQGGLGIWKSLAGQVRQYLGDQAAPEGTPSMELKL
jgi:hypothetical protein